MNTLRLGNTAHVIYDSLEELEAIALPACRANNMYAYRASVEGEGDRATWFGLAGDGNAAREKILYGWPELLNKLRPMRNQIELGEAVAPHRAIVRRRKMTRGDYGDVLDIQRVYAGELDRAWTRPKRRNLYGVTDRRATIVVNVSASASTGFDEVLWRAATAIKVCSILQASGRSVEIYSGNSVNHLAPNFNARMYCCIKEYLQPLQEERLAAMVSLSFLRTYMFVASGAFREKVSTCLGYPTNGLPAQLEERKKSGELVVELARCFSLADAKRDLENVHKQLLGEGQ